MAEDRERETRVFSPASIAEIATLADLSWALRQLRRREARQRGASELTYRELAARTGWSVGIIAQYLTGKVLPPVDRFDTLVHLLGAATREQSALAEARDRVEERRGARVGADRDDAGRDDAGRDAAGRDGSGGAGPAGAGPGRVVPRQLPPPVRHFAGRSAELEALTHLVDQVAEVSGTVIISAIDGMAGIGKTALAVWWAHQVADRFPDGQAYVNLRGFDPAGPPVKPADALRHFLGTLGVPPERIPAGLDAQSGLYRSLLAGRRMLVVLDNARSAEQVRPLLPGAPGCLVVVTSRNRLTSLITTAEAQPITLDVLTDAEARELLTRRLGAARVAADPAAVDEIIVRCARLPLALSIVAARAATHPGFTAAALAAELRDARAGLDVFDGGDTTCDVRAVFSWSYHGLPAPPARLFRLLGLHPGPHVTTAAAASLAGLAPRQVRRLLADLARAHLVAEPAPGRFTLHDLLRAYAAELVASDPETDRREAIHRVLDHYLHTAHAAALLLRPYRHPVTLAPRQPGVTPQPLAEPADAQAWFAAEYEVLLAAVDAAAAASGFDTHAWQLAWTLADFFQRQGHWQDCVATQRVGLAAAQRLGDRTGQAHAHRSLGHAYSRLGADDAAQTHLQRAIDLFGELGEQVGEADAHMNLGYVLTRQERPHEAYRHAQQALDLYRAADHQPGQAIALNNVGWYHLQIGGHQLAIEYCERSLALHRQIGGRHGQAYTWDSLGEAHHQLAEFRQAATCYRSAIELFRETGDRLGEATALAHLGDTHAAAGDTGSAEDAWRGALIILDEIGHPDAEPVRARLQQAGGRLDQPGIDARDARANLP